MADMKSLAAYSRGGLADRIALALFSDQIASASKRRLEYLWPAEQGCYCEFERLFCPCEFSVLNPPAYKDAVRPIRGTFSETVRRIRTSQAELVHLDGFYGHDFTRFDEVFKPREAVWNQFRTFRGDHFRGQSIGVHIRRTDKLRFTIPAVERYFFAIDNQLTILPESSLFVASDDPSVELLAKRRYGNRLLHYPVRSHSRHRRDGIIDALTVLYLLRSCDFLVTGRFSGFSLLAAWDRPCCIIQVPGTPISRDWEGRPIYRPCSSHERWHPDL